MFLCAYVFQKYKCYCVKCEMKYALIFMIYCVEMVFSNEFKFFVALLSPDGSADLFSKPASTIFVLLLF